jgi:DNA-binding transcriptional LysR family regulator
VRFALTTLSAIALLVDRGLGVALVPDWPPPWPEGLSLKKLPIADASCVRRLGLLWYKASARLRLVNALLEQAARPHAG